VAVLWFEGYVSLLPFHELTSNNNGIPPKQISIMVYFVNDSFNQD
jgi:hypothetical protein